MTLLALAGLAWHSIPLVTIAALTAFLLRFLASSEDAQGSGPSAKSPSGLPEWLALAVSATAVLVVFAASASAAATSPDLLLFWGPKAQAFVAARTVDAAFLREPLLDYLHVSYPPLVTNLYAFASIVGGRLAWGAATLTFPLCLAVLAFSLPGTLRSAAPRPIAWAASALVVSAFGYLGYDLDVAGNGEPWLWLSETLAMTLPVGGIGTTRAGQLLAGLLLSGAASAKVEGLPFALAAAMLFLLLRKKEARSGPAAALLLTPSLLSLGAWLAFGATRHLFRGYEQCGRFFGYSLGTARPGPRRPRECFLVRRMGAPLARPPYRFLRTPAQIPARPPAGWRSRLARLLSRLHLPALGGRLAVDPMVCRPGFLPHRCSRRGRRRLSET